MRAFPVFAILFFAIPLLEIYFLIQVGEVIGAWPTILLVVLTAVLGAFLLRQQGLSTLARFQNSMAQGDMPATALLEGVMLLIGGALLMTPGFFTDAIGFACLLPFTRQWLAKAMLKKATVRQFQGSGAEGRSSFFHYETHSPDRSSKEDVHGSSHSSSTLDGEYTRKD